MAYVKLKWINLIDDSDKGELTASLPINIGRAPENDLVLAAKRVGVLRHLSVSRQHARLSRENANLMLIDQQSSNGVYVDNERISKTAVYNQAVFLVGAYQITLTMQQQCNNDTCQKLVDTELSMCPWCGRFMADAMTQEGGHFYVKLRNFDRCGTETAVSMPAVSSHWAVPMRS